MAQPEERPDFRLSCLSGPTPSPDSLQPPPLGGSSQPATRRYPSESLGLEFLRKWFHFDIVYFTVYTYCKGSCYSSLNRRWSSWAGNEWLWYWVGWLLWRENRWVIWQWRGLSIAVGCSRRKGFWVFFFGWWWAGGFLTFYGTFGSKKCKNCYLAPNRIWSIGCPMVLRYEYQRYLSFRKCRKPIRIVPEILYRWIVRIVSRAN